MKISLKNLYISHRGYHNINDGIPENSILSFKKSLDYNHIIELDVHLLKDNKIVVFHDDNLKRVTGIDKKIKDCTYDELNNLKLFNTKEIIPLFEDVLKLVNGKVMLDIELKSDNKVGKLEEELVKLLENYKGEFIVKSFNPFTIRWFNKNRPNYIVGLLCSNYKKEKMNIVKKFVLKHMLFNSFCKFDFLAYNIHALPNKKISKYRKKGFPIFVWVIRNTDELDRAKEYGDSFIFEQGI